MKPFIKTCSLEQNLQCKSHSFPSNEINTIQQTILEIEMDNLENQKINDQFIINNGDAQAIYKNMNIFHNFLDSDKILKKKYLQRWRKNDQKQTYLNPFIQEEKMQEMLNEYYSSSSSSQEEIRYKIDS